jgi:hypothetical protein
MPTPIEERHATFPLDLGPAQGPEQDTYDGGSLQVYQFGRFYFHPRLPMPFAVYGAILDAYLQIGGELSQLGYPTSDEEDDPSEAGGRMNTFENGVIRWSPAAGVSAEVDDSPPVFVDRVVVKVFDNLPVSIDPGSEVSITDLLGLFGPVVAALPAANDLVQTLGAATVRRTFGSISVADIDSLVQIAQSNDPSYSPPNFDRYFTILVPDGVDADTVAGLAGQLSAAVEFAYVAAEPIVPVVGTTNPRFANQTYLSAGPTGIGVQSAWNAGADGTGVRFIDLELGWFLGHDDLQLAPPIRLLDGKNQASSHFHGTAVLGIVAAKDDSKGIVGIAPAAQVDVISYERPGLPVDEAIAEEILLATIILNPGDVLLLEISLKPHGTPAALPCELAPETFEAIRLATKVGIVVVEAAGNGGTDLKFAKDFAGGKTVLDPSSADFRDSGAIMVGGCTAAFPHQRHPRSNNGDRIDCHAFAERIEAAGHPFHPNQRDAFIGANDTVVVDGITHVGFGGTSGASAIVAGVCLLVQHLTSILTPVSASGRFTPDGMRTLLRNANNGTDSFLVTDLIGAMPDLAKIIANEFV